MTIKNKFLRNTLKVISFIPVLLWVLIGALLYYLGNWMHQAGNWITQGKLE